MHNEVSGSACADLAQFHVSIPVSWIEALVSALTAAAARPAHDPRIDEILSTVKEIKTMSGQFSTDLATQTANLADLSDAMTTGFAANDAAIQALKDKIAAGGAVSAADLATFETNNAAIKTAADGIRAHLNVAPPPPPPAHIPEDTANATANAPGGRNNFFLPGFDPTQPETP
jgi:hypothetical protein